MANAGSSGRHDMIRMVIRICDRCGKTVVIVGEDGYVERDPQTLMECRRIWNRFGTHHKFAAIQLKRPGDKPHDCQPPKNREDGSCTE